MRSGTASGWLVSPRFDVWMFGIPALVALALVPLGPWLAPSGETPLPMWLLAVLGIDVAHVWATLYKTYLDPAARARRGGLLFAVPIFALAVSAAVAHLSLPLFWTGLAYLAVFHFVRQQYGWVALHHRKDPELGAFDRRLDVLAIYASTLYPLLWWHAHLPRSYVWFLPGDFVAGAVPRALADGLFVPYLGLVLGWQLRQALRRARGEGGRPGLWLVMTGTTLCWGVGIIATDTDWAFTVTNVIIHGVPYLGFVWVTAPRSGRGLGARLLGRVWAFYGLLLGLAAMEELGWERAVWSKEAGAGVAWATALLAVPQITHYVLDGVIWRRPRVDRGGPPPAPRQGRGTR